MGTNAVTLGELVLRGSDTHMMILLPMWLRLRTPSRMQRPTASVSGRNHGQGTCRYSLQDYSMNAPVQIAVFIYPTLDCLHRHGCIQTPTVRQ